MRFLQTKVAMALIGVILIGGGSVLIVFMTAPHSTIPVATANIAPTATATQTAAKATATPTVTPTSLPGSGQQPTATPTPQASTTATPITTPTTTPTSTTGQTVNLSGRIGTVGNNTFAFTSNSVSYTVVVNGQTAYSGGVTSFQQVKAGQRATIHGTLQGSTITATSVNVQTDN
jgi:hypothetical protein